jgi:hypothetical protein
MVRITIYGFGGGHDHCVSHIAANYSLHLTGLQLPCFACK